MRSILVYDIQAEAQWLEVLLAFLGELPFDSFQEHEAGISAYLDKNIPKGEIEADLARLQQMYPFTYAVREMPGTNWNAVWESRFQPIRVGNFCGVRAEFHYPFLDVTHEVVITPQMTFGTGHHETTYMMLEAMEGLDMEEAKVLDFGCGTGILAILAAKMGATMIDAVDIEEEAYQNTMHNAQLNNVDSIQAIHGNLDAILDTGYRVILANINRNVILSSLPALSDKLARHGVLLVSGILREDKAELARQARRLGFRTEASRERGEWACLLLVRAHEN